MDGKVRKAVCAVAAEAEESAMGLGEGEGVDGDFTLQQAWISIHETYLCARRAGFGRFEALWMTSVTVKGVPMPDWLTDLLLSHTPPTEEEGT